MYPTLESPRPPQDARRDHPAARKEILEKCGTLTAAQLNDPVYPAHGPC